MSARGPIEGLYYAVWGEKGPEEAGNRLWSWVGGYGKGKCLAHLVTWGDAAHHICQVSNGGLLFKVPWEGLSPLR